MKAGEHLKTPSGMYQLGYKKGKRYIDYNPAYTSKETFLTLEEWCRIKSLNVDTIKIKTEVCPLCGQKYIPTPQSKRRCIPCSYDC